ncbi:MAG: ATP-binding cassette domain-containing protein, partial [Phyllobacterium sp.]
LAPPPPDRPVRRPQGRLAVRLDAVRVRHEGARRPSLQGLSLELARGERLALIGASGCGKSTLLGLVAGEIEAEHGLVARLEPALLTQRTELFQDSLRDNLLLAAPETDDAGLLDVLAVSGLADFVTALPRGLDTRLGEGGLGLSGGQARRLALARLLLRKAPLWLLDEVSEGVDGETARDVLGRLAERMHGRTVILATHNRREAMLADRLLILDEGRVVAAPRRGESEFAAALAGLRPD